MGEGGEGRYDIIVHNGEPKIRNKVFLEEMKGTYIKQWAKKHKVQAKKNFLKRALKTYSITRLN